MKVFYATNIPAPYMVERFGVLAREADLDFRASFLTRTESDRSWHVDEKSWLFDGFYVGTGLRGARRNLSAIRQFRPEIVVSLYERVEFIGALAGAKLVRCPSVIHVMNIFDTWRQPRASRELAKRLLFPHVDVHVTGSDSRSYALRYGAHPDRIHVVAEPVSLEVFGPAPPPADQGLARRRSPTFLYVGRLWRKKGIGDLLEAFAALRVDRPDARLLLAGDGVDDEFYREQGRSIGGVDFLGFVQRPAMPAVYAAADALIFPTLGDPYGYVIEESMAAGVPVVTTSAIGDLEDRLTPGRDALVVPPNRPDALLAAMRSLMNDVHLRQALTSAARARVEARSVDSWATSYAAMLRGVVEAHCR